ncbi:hypothetical protein AGOR_G00102030 [Albula goreensis]|uniref:BHLH domain-containing protein n=1 Tax=Albula goreensis TaxID=1534307 RepID=A0A8T3DFP2_9TELE|nr:hypothetical protein AGOR_G00102030 [Albula goreensis]
MQCVSTDINRSGSERFRVKTQMLGLGASALRHDCSWETEYDRYQHYFYDGDDPEEDFYKSTAPSEDIWKKFELVPTPPTSPIRSADGGDFTSRYPSLGDKLERVSQFLGQDEEQEGQYKIDTNEIFGNLSSIINQDCMWSGFSASQRLEKAVNERLSCPAEAKTPLGTQADTYIGSRSLDSHITGTFAVDCVDPAAVFTYPYNSNCSAKKQASSGSESRTDSSDDEEIDVVTVENKQKRGRWSSSTGGGRKPVTITVHPDPQRPRTPPPAARQQAGLSGAYLLPPSATARPRARPWPRLLTPERDSSSAASPNPATPRLTDSPQSSDSEDADKRKNHNFLERKRRNDLRSRFLALRDQVPGLVGCPKTPKVVILTRAAEYLRQLHAGDRQHVQERRQLKARQRQLLSRLAELKRT